MRVPNSVPQSENGGLSSASLEPLVSQNTPEGVFMLPSRILKNLTPISQPQARILETALRQAERLINHQRRLLEKSRKLQERSYAVSKRVENARIAQKRALHTKAATLACNLKNAEIRRAAHLEKVRKRARQCFKNQLLAPEAVSVRIRASQTQNPAAPSILCHQGLHIRCILLIQRRIRAFLLLRSVEKITNSGFLALLDSPSEIARDLLANPRTASSGFILEGLLRLLNLPDVTEKGGYNTFKYGFILIYEFSCFVESRVHPSFHSLLSTGDNLAAKALPVLLLKTSTALIEGLKCLLQQPKCEITNPFSETRLNFSRLWKAHHFFFLCFKGVHLENCLAISKEASSVICRQMAILEGFPERNTIERNHILLEKNTKVLRRAKNTASRPRWIDIGLSFEHVIAQLRFQMSAKLTAKSISGVIDHDFFNPENLRSKYVRIGNIVTYLPPHISGVKWRTFWLQKFLEEQKRGADSKYNVPENLKSGRRMFLHNRDLEDCYRLGIREISASYASKGNLLVWGQLQAVEDGIERCAHSAYQYILLMDHVPLFTAEKLHRIAGFSGTKGRGRASFSNRLRSFNERAKALSRLTSTFLQPEEVPEVPAFCRISEKSRDSAFCSIRADLGRILASLEHVEGRLYVRWAGICRFESFSKFKAFENGIRMLSYKNFSLSKGTNSPQLRFPQMYHFIGLCRPPMEENVVSSFGKMAGFFSSLPPIGLSPALVCKKRPLAFFREVFAAFATAHVHLRISEKMQKFRGCENELLDLFQDKFTEMAAKTQALVITSVVVVLVEACTDARACQIAPIVQKWQDEPGAVFSRAFPGALLGALPVPPKQRDFAVSLLRSELAAFQKGKCPIAHILASRARDLLSQEAPAKSRRAARSLWGARAAALADEFSGVCTQVYEVYNPLLNWIHGDLGEP